VTPRTVSQFKGRVLILPDVRCLDDDEVASLRRFASASHRLIITGNSGGLRIDGEPRRANPLRQLTPAQGALWMEQDFGATLEQILSRTYASAAANASSSIPDAEQALAHFETDILKNTDAGRKVSITASPFVISQIATVKGKLHLFLSNFKGIIAKQNPAPKPESNTIVQFPNSAGSHIYGMPYLGERVELPSHALGDKLIVNVPAFTRSIVIWCE
jgi:hypothetical protein